MFSLVLPRLMEVRVIDYEAAILAFILAAQSDLVPKLTEDAPKALRHFTEGFFKNQ